MYILSSCDCHSCVSVWAATIHFLHAKASSASSTGIINPIVGGEGHVKIKAKVG